MKNWLRLLIPIGLGVVAAGINYFVMNQTVQPHAVVAMTADMSSGDVVQLSSVETKALAGDVGTLLDVVVPANKKAVVFGQRLSRDLKRGDLLLWRDIEPPPTTLALLPGEVGLKIPLDGIRYEPNLLKVGSNVGFVIPDAPKQANAPKEPPRKSDSLSTATVTGTSERRLRVAGPFRIVSVGARLESEASAAPKGAAVQTPPQILTIATKLTDNDQLDAQASLVAAAIIDKERGGSGIAVLVLYRTADEPTK